MQKLKAKIKALPHQIEFANYPGSVAMVGGYGSGKSEGIVFRANNLIKKRKGKGLIVIGAPTYTLADDVNIPDFENFYDRYKIPYKIHRGKRKILVNGSVLKGEVWFRSYDRPERWVGFDASDFILDEFDTARRQRQKEIWDKAIARIRKCTGATGSIGTTPEGFKYTYELTEVRKILHKIKAKTTDNVFLPKDYIENLFRQYDEKLVEQYINGEYVNINGHAAYYAFSRDNNVIPNSEINSSLIKVGIDFNVDPMTASFGIRLGDQLIIFDEAYLKNSNTYQMAEYIKAKFPDKDIEVCPDMTGIKRKTSAMIGMSDITILQRAGFRISGKSNPHVRDRLNLMNAAFNQRKVLIMERCQYLIRDCEQVTTDEYGEIVKKNLELTHLSDGLGYLVHREFPELIRRKYVW